jgi:hypothetical protein
MENQSLDYLFPSELQISTKSTGGSRVEYVVAGPDRFESKTKLEAVLKENDIDYSDGVKSSSSVDIRTTDVKIGTVTHRFFYKPKSGGGSGAGAEITALGECFQAYACAARQFNKKPLDTAEDIFNLFKKNKVIMKSTDCDRTLEQCKAKLDPGWLRSGVEIANLNAAMLRGKTYIFHRGGDTVTAIEKTYERLKKKAGIKLNINKWNPSDMWCIQNNYKVKTDFDTLDEFNEYLLEQFNAGTVIGLSLKKLANNAMPHEELFNVGAKPKKVSFVDFRISAAGKEFWDPKLSKDAYISYKEGGSIKSMQLRTFSAGMSGWQGEIKGTSAAGGKIGGGNLQESLMLAKIPSSAFIDQSSFKSHSKTTNPATVRDMAKFYKHLEKDRTPSKQVESLMGAHLKQFDNNWLYSKYLSMQFIYVMTKYKKEDQVAANLVSIASSSTPVSSVFVKYS